MPEDDLIIDFDELVLITGSNGFIGSRVVEALLHYGFRNLRCFVRPSSDLTILNKVMGSLDGTKIEVVKGNLLSSDDCRRATKGVSVIFHLAAGIEKSFAGCYMNSVMTTRNLLDSIIEDGAVKRFLNVSSLAVYSNLDTRRRALLDETCRIETEFMQRYEPYVFGKVKQDELLLEYNRKHDIPYVIVRPAPVYGPGKESIPARVGIGTFGVFLHLGGLNRIPLTYVDNCADAIVLAGTRKGIDSEVFNIVDDDLPRSRTFLRMYKKHVRRFRSIYIPYPIFYSLCGLWEKYSRWSEGQLPPAFNRRRCAAYWKGSRYSNKKSKRLLGWRPRVPFDEGASRHFEYLKERA